jgi:hypothetical protein
MKKIILFCYIILSTSLAYAENITLNVPFSDTGNNSSINRIIAAGLKEKGWNIDIKITSNPKLSKEIYINSKKPLILAWGTAISASKQDTHYLLPANKDDLIGFTHTHGVFLCSSKDISKTDLTTKSYKIGTFQDTFMVKWSSNFQKYLGGKDIFIAYDGSARVINALFSGEVDMAFISNGPSFVKDDKLKCILNTGDKKILDIPLMKETFPNFNKNEFITGQYWQVKNLSEVKLEKLRKDFSNVIINYTPYLNHVDSKFYSSINYDLERQLKMIHYFDSNIE